MFLGTYRLPVSAYFLAGGEKLLKNNKLAVLILF
ncbi:hypothetical protein CHY_1606 [Carboxydothermus hydrogenoformans Z-2901]|uniref:Uncharacterized protein n=1 Tax=Carboxydothermus hydrogenoformans (strain ATCC BAA-161 / DSM 6008 / Z-2901) TaxID=246194 RepID=Q3ABQ0_CARHZ|nr:hypothetical protein CHY_1606 [Carboxydothermus hydrogenoformans Z-2901]